MEISHYSIESKTRRILNKTINEYRLNFPAPVNEVRFVKRKDVLLIDFFDDRGISISDKMLTVPISETESLHSRIASQFNTYLEKSNYLVIGKEYSFRPFIKKSAMEYIDIAIVANIIRKRNEVIKTLGYQINIDQSILYAMSNAQIRNYTVNSLLKICFFFKKPIFYFLNRKYKKQYLEIITDEFISKKLISKEKKEEIMQSYFPPSQT